MSARDWDLTALLGIDLGTTFSAVARWNEISDEPDPLQTQQGKETLQSVVYYDPDTKEICLGQLAYARGMIKPENMAMGIKRMMDRPEEQIVIGGRAFTPIELSSLILKKMYSDVAEKYPSGLFKSRGSIVTVPYYFKAHQNENTRKAAELAEICCRGILQEPIAASLSYTWDLVKNQPDRVGEETILVFDLGGGTFDLTLFKLKQNKTQLIFEVLATGGDDPLGGMDFTNCLGELLLEKSNISLAGLPPQKERLARQKLYDVSEEVKIALSQSTSYFAARADVADGQHINTTVMREEFERCISSYLEKIPTIVERALAAGQCTPRAVNRVLLVGGSSRMPCITHLLADIFSDQCLWKNADPSLCVAKGAAMYAAYIDDPGDFPFQVEIIPRTCHALGVEIEGGAFDVIIPANKRTPCMMQKIFTPNKDNVTNLDINVFQGAARLVKDNTRIGTLRINGLPKRPRGQLDVKVTFHLLDDQSLSVKVEAENIVITENWAG